MGFGVYTWAAASTLAVLGLAAVAVRRPIVVWVAGAAAPPSSHHPIEAAAPEAPRERVRWARLASGFVAPLDLQFVPGSTDRAVVVEKGGRVRLVSLPSAPPPRQHGDDGSAVEPPSTEVDVCRIDVRDQYEVGLLGLAFHPDYQENGLFYTFSNPSAEPVRSQLSEWQLPAHALGKSSARRSRVLLEFALPFMNHVGGQLAFGPDGMLYVGIGDGGSQEDPNGNGQNLSSLFGKILRVDVDGGGNYRIPPDNPFQKVPGARAEIWAYGLRNPWRFSFDPEGRLIAGDVGQARYEEVAIVPRAGNLGWKVREGSHCFFPMEGCSTEGLIDPVFEYGHDAGQSITGGHVYGGALLPWLRDRYVAGDFVTGRVWALELPDRPSTPARSEELGVFPHAFSSFALGPSGELYALDFARGFVLLLAPA